MNPTETSLSPSIEYPSLFEAADTAAASAQQKHLLLSFADLGLLVVAAIASAFSPFEAGAEKHKFDAAALATGIVLVIALAVTLVGRIGRFDRRWFSARAIAESVKTTTWRFMMGVPPHNITTDSAADAKAFCDKLKELLSAEPDSHLELAGHATGPWIRGPMIAIREMSLGDKIALYRSKRVQEQRDWYSRKAKEHRAAEQWWFGAAMVVHVSALILAFVSAIPEAVPFNITGFLTTLAASFFAWVQLRDHQNLAQSYAMISHELSAISDSTSPSTEKALIDFVEDVERTISREHSLWISRRTK